MRETVNLIVTYSDRKESIDIELVIIPEIIVFKNTSFSVL